MTLSTMPSYVSLIRLDVSVGVVGLVREYPADAIRFLMVMRMLIE
jgi:hypothetical protein